MNKYKPYRNDEIDVLLKEPWEVTDRPYMLHAAFALNSLVELCASESEEDGELDCDSIWGKTIPQNVLNSLLKDVADDFNDAAKNRKPIKINNRSYSIRKVNAYDRTRLIQVFDFEKSGNDFIISKSGVMDLVGECPAALTKYELTKEQSADNRIYLRQIIMLAEDDANNGWDKLTDMEIVLYCWALYYHKTQCESLPLFIDKYKDYIYVDTNDISRCFTDMAALREKPVGLYTFSKQKVVQWNESHNQRSYAAAITPEEAENYWYDIALSGNFRPIQ